MLHYFRQLVFVIYRLVPKNKEMNFRSSGKKKIAFYWTYACFGLLLFLGVSTPLRAQWKAEIVDEAAANRGDQIYAQSCSKCHGGDARGTAAAPDLLRSEMVLHDRMNNLNGTFIEESLKTLPNHHFDLTRVQWIDLSQALDRDIHRILRSGYSNQPTDLLSGDPRAGEAFFNGTGGCNKCHSPTGDLAHIATEHGPAVLQQRFLFPNSILRGLAAAGAPKMKPAQVTVKLNSGEAVSGDLVRIDDFNVTLRDARGETRTWRRRPGVHINTSNPYAAHIALLDKYTDTDIHNMTAYLETLK